MFFFEKSLEKKRLDACSERTIKAHGGKLMAVEVHFDAGGIGAMHSHPHEQLVYILEGEADFTIAGETQRVRKGDSIYIEPDIEHGVKAISEFRALDVFSPQRDDFL